MTRIIIYILLGSTFLLFSCSKKETPLFENLSADKTGIRFTNQITSTPELNILNYIYFYNGAGVASADFNNDGLIDLYFTANQTPDALYLNQGDFQFSDITDTANIDNESGWTNGVAIVDINGDGWMDLYLTKVGDHNNLKGTNLLYVNQGINSDGIPKFTEMASVYGLDFSGFSTHASFFDYDRDGDLDLYLLNHSINPNQNYGKGRIREIPNRESGDKLFENQEGHFKDVSEDAGIFQSKFGYGLGVSISDLNDDGYPDIYVSNDFFENDYLYLNNQNKTFTEVIHKNDSVIGHTTHFSMGNDIHDINNDGHPDIISLDMLPEDPQTYKTSGTEFNYQIYQNYIRNGYAHQYMQNALQLNQGNGTFSETGNLSGIAATEWSWSPLMADFDNDGKSDIFISNGILGATNDMDFINFIANDNIQKSLGRGMTEKEMAFIDKIPVKKTPNYIFQNQGNNQFNDKTNEWLQSSPSFSNGATYADLDNDGDLDLVVNNVNEPAYILKNQSRERFPLHSFLKVKLDGSSPNTFGVGAIVTLYSGTQQQRRENITSRGYLSSVAPEVLFGLGASMPIDSLTVLWPDGRYQSVYDVQPNSTVSLIQENAKLKSKKVGTPKDAVLQLVSLPLAYQHKENANLEFNRDPLLPFALGNEGPAIAVGDINSDGRDDLFLGGAKGQPGSLFIQSKDEGFEAIAAELFATHSLAEDTDAVIADVNNDSFNDLIVVSGGNEFTSGPQLQPRLYINNQGTLEWDADAFATIAINASSLTACDWNSDGAIDLIISSNGTPQQFGKSAKQYLFQNDGSGQFTDVTDAIAPEFGTMGHVNDVKCIDFNQDGSLDIIAVGDWNPIGIFLQKDGNFKLQKNNGLDQTHGWWNTVTLADMDQDGDLDILAGNWGLNTRLRASQQTPINLYKSDFDGNGSEETVVTYTYKGAETTLASKEELTKQMPVINKNYLSFKDFAEADVADIFGADKLRNATLKQIYMLESAYFENDGNGFFNMHPLPFDAQLSSVNAISVEDFNTDGKPDVFLVGNNYEISTQLGRLDAQKGTLFINEGEVSFKPVKVASFGISGACRAIQPFTYRDIPMWIVTRNNQKPIFIQRSKSQNP